MPYIDEYKDRYTAVGYMGIELQKVLDEVQKQNNEFFRNEIIGESKSEIFDTVKNEIGDYEQYHKNVREFEHLSEMGKTRFMKLLK